MIENIKLMTRSTASDYEFFGTETSAAWLHKYQQYLYDDSKANGMTLFGEIDNSEWKLFVGRIPSSNRDSYTRQLSYILKAEGTRGNSDSLNIAKLITFILKIDFEMKTIGERFSNEFSIDYIDGLDSKRHTEETENEIREKLESVFQSINIELSECANKIDGLKYDSFSSENAEIMSGIIALIADKDVQIDGKIMFAVTELPIDGKEDEKILTDSNNVGGLILTTNKVNSLPLPFVKKKSISLKAKIPTEFHNTSKIGWTKILKIPTVLLIISLITNCVLIFSILSKTSEVSEQASLLRVQQDSLNLLKKSEANYSELLTKSNHSLDSLTKMQCYKDVHFDLAEFSTTGNCKIYVVNKNDTISVYSNFDLAKNKCNVSVCKGGVSKGGADVNLK